jgi:hypothetical protein
MHTQSVSEDRSLLTLEARWRVLYPQIERLACAVVADTRRASVVGERDLVRQLLLHLPRFSTYDLSDPNVIRGEAGRLAARIESKRLQYGFWQDRPRLSTLVKNDFVLKQCEPHVARVIHEVFHYIGSYHQGIVHLGLFSREEKEFPMALASLAPMDIVRLDSIFKSGEEKKQFLVVSRVFAFDWAPRNTISYLLGRVTRWVTLNLPGVKTLLTFLNPNLGFSGAAFSASNWKLFLEMEPVSSYLHDNYVPYRVLKAMPENLRKHVRQCQHDLAPLKLLRYDLQAR